MFSKVTGDVDSWLGKILDAIENSNNKGLKDRTIVITSSDHGDFSGDYGCVEKWPGGVDDVLTRVPLIINVPKGYGGGTHLQTNAPVQLFDVMATVLDYAGIKPKHTHFAQSLASIVNTGKVTAAQQSRYVFSEGGYLYPTEVSGTMKAWQ